MFGNKVTDTIRYLIITAFVLLCLFVSGKSIYNSHIKTVDDLKDRVSQLDKANKDLEKENSNLKKDLETKKKIEDVKDDVFEKDTQKQDEAKKDQKKISDDSSRRREEIRKDDTIPTDKKNVLILQEEWKMLHGSQLLLEQSANFGDKK